MLKAQSPSLMIQGILGELPEGETANAHGMPEGEEEGALLQKRRTQRTGRP